MLPLHLLLYLGGILDRYRALQEVRYNFLNDFVVTSALLLPLLQLSQLLRLLTRFRNESAHQARRHLVLLCDVDLGMVAFLVGLHDLLDVGRGELTTGALLVLPPDWLFLALLSLDFLLR